MLSKEEIEFNLKALSVVMLNFEDRLCDEMQERVQKVRNYIDQLESDKQKLIEKLEKDIVNITKTMQDGKHCDDYSRCRLKAYRTKTKEILSIVKGVENES